MRTFRIFPSILVLICLTACTTLQTQPKDHSVQIAAAFAELIPSYQKGAEVTVIHKAEHRGKSYAVIAVNGNVDPPTRYLLEYSEAKGKVAIQKYASGTPPVSSGLAENTTLMGDVGVYWSEVAAQRLGKDPKTGSYDYLIDNPDTEIPFCFADGEIFKQPIDAPGFCAVFFEKDRLPEQIYIVESWVDCKFYPADWDVAKGS